MAAPKFDAPTVMPSGQPLRYMSFDTNPDMFGAGIGRAIEGFGATVGQVAKVFEANAEKMRVEAAKTSANQAFVDASVKAGQAEADYFTTMGTQAQTQYPTFLENLKTIRQEAIDSLEDDDAKAFFDDAFQSNMLSGITQGSTHAAKQGTAAAVDAAQARVELALNDSATKFADESLFQTNLGVIQQQVIEQGRLQGWTPEVVMSKIHTLNSAAWESRITSMAASDPVTAKKTFDRVRDEMTVESRLRVQNSVINSLETSAAALGVQDARNGFNGNVRPAFREGVIQGGRSAGADQFLISRTSKGAESVTGLHPLMSDRLAALISTAPPGIRENITIFSGYRDSKKQAQLFDAAVKKYGSVAAARKWVAPPGKSHHNFGTAVDLGWKGGSFNSMPPQARAWLHENAAAFGLNFRMGHEPWHIELSTPSRAPAMEKGTFVNRIMYAEGGGAGVSSPAGAVGLMQVMPGTARDVAYALGIPYDQYRLMHDDNYNLLIGTAYLNQMLDKYDGNEWLAAAAYNAGPGAVDGWIKQFGDPRLGQISSEQWAAQIPFAETRGYVSKVMGSAGQPVNIPVSPNMSRAEYDMVIEEAYGKAEMMAPGNALFAERYVGGVRQVYDQMVADQKARIAENYDSLTEALVTPDESGKTPGTEEFNAMLQNNPEFAAMWDELSGANKKTIYELLRSNDKRNTGSDEDVITDASLTEYDRLSGMWRTDNNNFKKEDIASNPNLTQAQKKALIDLKRQQPPSENAPTPVDIDLSAALRVGGSAIAAAGIEKGKPGTAKAKQFDTFMGSLSRILNEETTRKGRKLTEVEMRDIVQNLLIKNTVGGQPITLFGDWAPSWAPKMGSREVFTFEDLDFYPRGGFVGADSVQTLVPTVPPDARQTIMQQYQAKTGQVPTDALINQIYFQYLKGRAVQ